MNSDVAISVSADVRLISTVRLGVARAVAHVEIMRVIVHRRAAALFVGAGQAPLQVVGHAVAAFRARAAFVAPRGRVSPASLSTRCAVP